jgi:hypothetical protein
VKLSWPVAEGSGSVLAVSVLGMIVTFMAGWVLASITVGKDGDAGTASASSPLPAGAGSPSTSTVGPLPSDLPTGPLTGGGQGELQSSSNVALPKLSKAAQAPIARFSCPTPTVRVSTADELTAALSAARPGAVIGLAAGVYQGEFSTSRSGSAKRPIYLCGGRDAVLDAGSIKGGYTLHLNGASYWRMNGFTVQDGQKGVMVDGATGVGLQNLLLRQIGDEAVHLRHGSTRNVVRGLTVQQTGLRRDRFGEGVYIGTAQKNWCEISACSPDRSDGNFVLGNSFSATSSEAIDIKEGTSGGVVAGNRFDGAGITGADSWVDVKGNGWLIANNRGTRAPIDGYQVHEILDGWGELNVFSGNISVVNATGYAIKVTKTRTGNVVRCNNRSAGAQQGLTNITCS